MSSKRGGLGNEGLLAPQASLSGQDLGGAPRKWGVSRLLSRLLSRSPGFLVQALAACTQVLAPNIGSLLASLYTGCVALENLINFSGSQLSHL